MKYKLLFGFFAFALMVVNVSQSFKIDQIGLLSLSQLSNTAYARTEEEPTQDKFIEIVEFETEPCDTCERVPGPFNLSILKNCTCDLFIHTCVEDSSGTRNCTEITYKSGPYDCKDSGKFCGMF